MNLVDICFPLHLHSQKRGTVLKKATLAQLVEQLICNQ